MDSNTHDIARNQFMLTGGLARQGYDWWWHSFTGRDAQTGEEKPFFIEVFACNPALGGDEPVFGQLPENKAAGIKPSYVMVKAGCWGKDARQLHRFFGWNEATVKGGVPFSVKAGDCYASENVLRGSVSVSCEDAAAHPEWMSDAGTMEWNLLLDKQIAFNVGYGASAPMRQAEAFEMYWHVEGMKTLVNGTVRLDGRTYTVDGPTSYGYADKNWGKNFTSPWVWLASSHLTSTLTGKSLENSAFDIGGGRPKVYAMALPHKLLGSIVYEGETYEFNFSKAWTGSTTEFDCRETDEDVVWHVVQDTHTARLETDIRCSKADMLLIDYEAPDGSKRYNRLWNGGNGEGLLRLYSKKHGVLTLIDEILAENVGCEYGEFDA
ncbi:tocopherol cyclase family protein [Slackia heliotrinireducens]|uniref:tocopherol cyclase family protein n=1 Tax=Slackia heliotrinireducens TaxID=84110 RepID=UPI0033154D0B